MYIIYIILYYIALFHPGQVHHLNPADVQPVYTMYIISLHYIIFCYSIRARSTTLIPLLYVLHSSLPPFLPFSLRLSLPFSPLSFSTLSLLAHSLLSIASIFLSSLTLCFHSLRCLFSRSSSLSPLYIFSCLAISLPLSVGFCIESSRLSSMPHAPLQRSPVPSWRGRI
jgi:hypothetical protein